MSRGSRARTSSISSSSARRSARPAGVRRFNAQYEALTIGTGGSITANTLGNKDLRPENTLETEYGIDAELFHKYGVNITYARDITTDELLLVPASVSSGFSNQWRNAGTMDGRTWEVSLNVPIITKKSLAWTSRLNWDQNRSYITKLDVPEYLQLAAVRFAVGERYGNVYGKQFVQSCSQLPSDFQSRCGAGKEWQSNDEGYIVWVGAGNSYQGWPDEEPVPVDDRRLHRQRRRLRRNSRHHELPRRPAARSIRRGASDRCTGACSRPFVIRTAPRRSSSSATRMPLWKIGWSHNLQFKRMNAYVLHRQDLRQQGLQRRIASGRSATS